MSTVSASQDSLDMFGETRDGGNIGVSSVLRDVDGVKMLIATVFGKNPSVIMGILSDIMESLREIKADTTRLKNDSSEIIGTLSQILSNQVSQYVQLNEEIEKIQAQISETNAKIAELDVQRAFDKAEALQSEITAMRKEMIAMRNHTESVLDSIATSVERIVGTKQPDEARGEALAGGNWGKIKAFMSEVKDRMGWKELVKRAATELGKFAFKSFISWITGGIVRL
jgi:hypothetical protein